MFLVFFKRTKRATPSNCREFLFLIFFIIIIIKKFKELNWYRSGIERSAQFCTTGKLVGMVRIQFFLVFFKKKKDNRQPSPKKYYFFKKIIILMDAVHRLNVGGVFL
jgi:hypothetical protein